MFDSIISHKYLTFIIFSIIISYFIILKTIENILESSIKQMLCFTIDTTKLFTKQELFQESHSKLNSLIERLKDALNQIQKIKEKQYRQVGSLLMQALIFLNIQFSLILICLSILSLRKAFQINKLTKTIDLKVAEIVKGEYLSVVIEFLEKKVSILEEEITTLTTLNKLVWLTLAMQTTIEILFKTVPIFCFILLVPVEFVLFFTPKEYKLAVLTLITSLSITLIYSVSMGNISNTTIIFYVTIYFFIVLITYFFLKKIRIFLRQKVPQSWRNFFFNEENHRLKSFLIYTKKIKNLIKKRKRIEIESINEGINFDNIKKFEDPQLATYLDKYILNKLNKNK